MKSSFKDTVKFSMKEDISDNEMQDVYQEVLSIKGVFDIAVDSYDHGPVINVLFNNNEDSVRVGLEVSYIDNVYSTEITPKEFYELHNNQVSSNLKR
jgi:hypothetical protein